jgi:hypothetical protein
VSSAHTTLLKFVRRELRRDSSLTPDQLVDAWRAHEERAGRSVVEADVDLIRALHPEEVVAAGERAAAPERGLVGRGCLLILGLNVGVFVLLGLLAAGTSGQVQTVATVVLVLIGLVQLVYVVPIGVRLRRDGQTATLQGVLIGAALTFLWSAACFAIVGSPLLRN